MSCIIDVHTHHISLAENSGKAIVSLSMSEESFRSSLSVCLKNHIPVSVGLHPWGVEADWQSFMNDELRVLLSSRQVLAVGEAGLDKIRGGLWEWQLAAFRAQIELAEEVGKPLLIHCVKAIDEIIHLRRDYSPNVPWIIHGFRGKKEQAIQLIEKGFYLSFGEYYHEEALRVCPTDRLLMETDESPIDIHALYVRAAQIKEMDVEAFRNQIKRTVGELFPSFL